MNNIMLQYSSSILNDDELMRFSWFIKKQIVNLGVKKDMK